MTASNFDLSRHEWPDVFDAAARAETAARSDPRASCFYARRALELAVVWMFKHDPATKLPYQESLSALIHDPTFKQSVGPALFAKARLIKDLGNLAAHSPKPLQESDSFRATTDLFHFLFWLARTYSREIGGQIREIGGQIRTRLSSVVLVSAITSTKSGSSRAWTGTTPEPGEDPTLCRSFALPLRGARLAPRLFLSPRSARERNSP